MILSDAEWDQRVQNGAEWFNDTKPSWLSLVDTDTLDMGSNCMLDQVFAEEARLNDQPNGFLWATREYRTDPAFDVSELGFGTGTGLRQAWLRLIRRLREEAGYKG